MSAQIVPIEEGWLKHFRDTCDRLSMSEVSRRLSCSTSVVSQIYHKKYPSPITKWRDRFLAEFEPGTVDCPVLGEIERELCSQNRKRPFAATNPQRVRLFHACRVCPNNPDRRVDE